MNVKALSLNIVAQYAQIASWLFFQRKNKSKKQRDEAKRPFVLILRPGTGYMDVRFLDLNIVAQYAQIAQSVEQGIENPRVGGSIPPLGTILVLFVVLFLNVPT